MNRYFSLLMLTFLFSTCNDKPDVRKEVKFIGNKQLPIFNSADSKIAILGADSVTIGEKYCVFITQTSKQLKMTSAYIGSNQERPCDFSKSLIDTALKQIDNCSIKLLVQNDTGFFCITPTKIGVYIHKLAVISVDNDSKYYLDTLDLKYISTEKTYP